MSPVIGRTFEDTYTSKISKITATTTSSPLVVMPTLGIEPRIFPYYRYCCIRVGRLTTEPCGRMGVGRHLMHYLGYMAAPAARLLDQAGLSEGVPVARCGIPGVVFSMLRRG